MFIYYYFFAYMMPPTSHLQETGRLTQNFLKEFYILSDLGMPWDSSLEQKEQEEVSVPRERGMSGFPS